MSRLPISWGGKKVFTLAGCPLTCGVRGRKVGGKEEVWVLGRTHLSWAELLCVGDITEGDIIQSDDHPLWEVQL